MLEVKSPESGLTIGAVARATGVAASTIRYYEAAGVLPRPSRKNGIRRYSQDVVDQVKIVRFCRAAGVPVRDLKWMADGGTSSRREAWSAVVDARIADLETTIRDAERTRALLLEAAACRCDEDDAECVVLQTQDQARARI